MVISPLHSNRKTMMKKIKDHYSQEYKDFMNSDEVVEGQKRTFEKVALYLKEKREQHEQNKERIA
jgi:hypothetical protein